MDWARAIERNQTALVRIVAALMAMVELSVFCTSRLMQPVYFAVLKILRPAESAARRLIVIAARGLKVELPPARPMPKGLVITGKGTGPIAFQLFDSRKRFNRGPRRPPYAKFGPRVWLIGSDPLVPSFQPREVEPPAPLPGVNAQNLTRRLAAIKLALETIPRQAERLARWQARRDRMKSPKFRTPLRPGPPPGHCKEPEEDVDIVLHECHALAKDALKADTS